MRRFLTLLALTLSLTLPATAEEFGPPDDVLRADILTGWRTKEGRHMAAVSFTLAPGWKTYWRAPGDAGIPTQFDWSGSKNVQAVQVHWPRPEVFLTNGYRTIGYANTVVLPIEILPKRAGEPVSLRAKVHMGVCESICIPAKLRLAAEISGAGQSDPAIHTALAQRPVSGARAGVRAVTCSIQPISDGIRLTAEIDMPRLGDEIAVIEAADPRIWVSEAETVRQGGRLTATADLVPPAGKAMAFQRDKVRITVLGQRQAVDIRGCSAG